MYSRRLQDFRIGGKCARDSFSSAKKLNSIVFQPRQETCSKVNYIDSICEIPDECYVDANCPQVRLKPKPICCADLSAELDRDDCQSESAVTARLPRLTGCSTQPQCPSFSSAQRTAGTKAVCLICLGAAIFLHL